MSDIEPGLDSHIGEPTPSLREGLPPKFRMRADAHYVEELDSALFTAPIRHLDVRTIDPLQRDGDHMPSADFVESVRRHGVLQPLLVRSRGGRFQVMAGSKRLAAALEAGLSEVPCLVERVDDEQARALAVATNVPSAAREASPAIRPERPNADIAFGAFADCLTAVASSAHLLSSGSALTQAVAVDLVRAEAARALHLLKALRVLRGEVSPLRSPLYPRAVLQRVFDETVAERRLRGVTLTIDRHKADGPLFAGDEDLLIAAIGSLVVAAPALLSGQSVRAVSLSATTGSDGAIVFIADHDAELPLFWRSILAEEDAREGSVPGGSATTSALTLLRAARQVAELHGGRMSVDCRDGMTSLSIAVPASR